MEGEGTANRRCVPWTTRDVCFTTCDRFANQWPVLNAEPHGTFLHAIRARRRQCRSVWMCACLLLLNFGFLAKQKKAVMSCGAQCWEPAKWSCDCELLHFCIMRWSWSCVDDQHDRGVGRCALNEQLITKGRSAVCSGTCGEKNTTKIHTNLGRGGRLFLYTALDAPMRVHFLFVPDLAQEELGTRATFSFAPYWRHDTPIWRTNFKAPFEETCAKQSKKVQ